MNDKLISMIFIVFLISSSCQSKIDISNNWNFHFEPYNYICDYSVHSVYFGYEGDLGLPQKIDGSNKSRIDGSWHFEDDLLIIDTVDDCFEGVWMIEKTQSFISPFGRQTNKAWKLSQGGVTLYLYNH